MQASRARPSRSETLLSVGLSVVSRTVITLAAASLTLAAVFVTGLPAFGVPSTPQIEEKQAAAAAVQADLVRMSDELEVLIEEHNALVEALEATRAEIREARDELVVAQQDLSRARLTLAERARAIYKEGRTGPWTMLLGARSFQDFLGRADLAVRINRSDARTVEAVGRAKSQVEQLKMSLEQRESEQVALESEASSRASKIEADIVAQQAYLASLDADVQRLIAEEEERQRQIAAERARQAMARAAGYSKSEPLATDPSSLGPGHPEAVAIALRYLGVPYVWGGSTPAGFDCSGLCKYVYAEIGIGLPRTSRSQYQTGQHIPADRLDLLVPGDLVFFGTDGDPGRVHHVGIYVGDGDFVHAPQTGDVVRVTSLTSRISSRGDYVGASRY